MVCPSLLVREVGYASATGKCGLLPKVGFRALGLMVLGFRAYGLGFTAYGLGFRVQGLGLAV